MDINAIGVVGCGLMGSGIAEVCARAGYNVVVREIDEDLLESGLSRIQRSLSKAVARGKLGQEQAEKTFERIQGTLDLAGFSACDLVIEAAI